MESRPLSRISFVSVAGVVPRSGHPKRPHPANQHSSSVWMPWSLWRTRFGSKDSRKSKFRTTPPGGWGRV